MRRRVGVFATIAVIAAVPGLTHLRAGAAPAVRYPGLACETPGQRSWAVKTLADPAARTVSLKPRPTTVAALIRLPRPANYHIGTRLRGVGTTLFRIRARLVGAQLETDHDIHLDVADPRTGRTMVVEFPDSRCWGVATSFAKPTMHSARLAFVRACGTVERGFTHLKGVATITGVGFFDRVHRHAVPGAAANAIELHPALAFSASGCSRS